MRRIGWAVFTLWLVSVVVFMATQALGDPARAILGRSATPERLAALRLKLHLDQDPLHRYLHWLGGIVRGDLGTSFASNTSVSSLIAGRVVNTVMLVLYAAIVIVPVAFLLALVAARLHDRIADNTIQVVSVTLAALPEFVIGILLVALFSTSVFHWLPSVALVSGASPWMNLEAMALPTLTLVLAVVPYVARILRASLVEVLESDYIDMARLKGVPERTVVARHALRNSLVPAIQVVALQIGWLVGGVVVVEFLFQYAGIGGALVDAVRNRDMPVVQILALLIAAVYVVVNLIADILTVLVSPRLRTAAAR
jgi:peptide/nickel transport system permease protein